MHLVKIGINFSHVFKNKYNIFSGEFIILLYQQYNIRIPMMFSFLNAMLCIPTKCDR